MRSTLSTNISFSHSCKKCILYYLVWLRWLRSWWWINEIPFASLCEVLLKTSFKCIYKMHSPQPPFPSSHYMCVYLECTAFFKVESTLLKNKSLCFFCFFYSSFFFSLLLLTYSVFFGLVGSAHIFFYLGWVKKEVGRSLPHSTSLWESRGEWESDIYAFLVFLFFLMA